VLCLFDALGKYQSHEKVYVAIEKICLWVMNISEYLDAEIVARSGLFTEVFRDSAVTLRYRVSRPKCSILSAGRNYVKQLHALHKAKTMNHSPPFKNPKGLMENEMCSIFDRKNSVKVCTSRPEK
jgi:hypothetical protein